MFLVFAINCVSQAMAWETMKKPPTTWQHHIVAGVTIFLGWTLVLSALAIAMSMTQAVSCPLPVPPGHIQSRIQGESHRGEAIILIPKMLFSFIWLCTSLLLIGPFLVVFVFLCLSTYLATFHSFHILIHLCVHVWLIGEGTRLGIWGLQLRVLPRLTTFLGQRGPLVPSLIGPSARLSACKNFFSSSFSSFFFSFTSSSVLLPLSP